MFDLASGVEPAALACESQLRIAAAMLRRRPLEEITATTVVSMLRVQDLSAFNSLIASIEDEFDVDAHVRLQVGACSVRFTRRARAPKHNSPIF